MKKLSTEKKIYLFILIFFVSLYLYYFPIQKIRAERVNFSTDFNYFKSNREEGNYNSQSVVWNI